MRLTFAIPGYLRPFAGGRAQVVLERDAGTVGQALSALFVECPGMRDRVLTEQGEVRPHVNIFVGDESIRFLNGLDTPLQSVARITVLPAVSGGGAAIRGLVDDRIGSSTPLVDAGGRESSWSRRRPSRG